MVSMSLVSKKKTYRSYYYVTTICHISFYFYAIGCRKWVKFLTHLLYTDKYHPSQVYPASTLSPRVNVTIKMYI